MLDCARGMFRNCARPEPLYPLFLLGRALEVFRSWSFDLLANRINFGEFKELEVSCNGDGGTFTNSCLLRRSPSNQFVFISETKLSGQVIFYWQNRTDKCDSWFKPAAEIFFMLTTFPAYIFPTKIS